VRYRFLTARVTHVKTAMSLPSPARRRLNCRRVKKMAHPRYVQCQKQFAVKLQAPAMCFSASLFMLSCNNFDVITLHTLFFRHWPHVGPRADF